MRQNVQLLTPYNLFKISDFKQFQPSRIWRWFSSISQSAAWPGLENPNCPPKTRKSQKANDWHHGNFWHCFHSRTIQKSQTWTKKSSNVEVPFSTTLTSFYPGWQMEASPSHTTTSTTAQGYCDGGWNACSLFWDCSGNSVSWKALLNNSSRFHFETWPHYHDKKMIMPWALVKSSFTLH